MGRARAWHLLTFLVTAFALVLQTVLVIKGGAHIPSETDPDVAVASAPDLATRLVRLVSYFTILSNVLVAITSLTIAARADRDTHLWRVLRLNAVVCITLTGIVHWFFLRPLLDLHGADWWADKLLHIVVPVLALVGWMLFGPRGRVDVRDLAASAIFPAVYMVYTLVRGELVGWYPYPFTDVDLHGYPIVLLNAVGIIVLLVLLSFGALKLDPRLPGES